MRRLQRLTPTLPGLLALLILAGCSTGPTTPRSASAPATLDPPPRYRVTLARSPLTEEQQVVHVLNRLGYGPRPGDVERVKRMGLNRWIERQLEPDRIPDGALEAALGPFPVLGMSAADLYRDYPPPNLRNLQRLQAGEMTPQEIRELFPPERRPSVINAQLQAVKVTRAIVSERQLQEVMVDFWFNHFNVFSGKGQVRVYLNEYERDAIRPHVLGTFRELLQATAENPKAAINETAGMN